MPRLGAITRERRNTLPLRDCNWFAEALNQTGLVKGGSYLVSGPPGAAKTTLSLQLATDVAAQGHRVAYVTFEQSIEDLKAIVYERIYRHLAVPALASVSNSSLPLSDGLVQASRLLDANDKFSRRCARIEENLYLEDSVRSVEGLSAFLSERIRLGDLRGTELIIVDSLQGQGLSGAATKTYGQVYEFMNRAKAAGIPVILTCHVTKAGSIAGPRSLEHNVDCVVYMRKAMRLRPLFVPKNRFGPDRHEPSILVMNRTGVLEPSKHTSTVARLAHGYLPGTERAVEVQATVKLPKFGETAKIKAPYLPREVIRQIVEIVGGLSEIDISEMTFDINCAIPGSRPFSRVLDLPLAISILSAYLQRPIPGRSLFIGELDLFRNIRPIDHADRIQALADMLSDGPGDPFRTIYLNPESAVELNTVAKNLRGASLVAVMNLDDAVAKVWPDIVD
jgi:DNA repair protein RadA/Sms